MTARRIRKTHTRRALTGIDRLYVTQVWTGTPYWLVRSRLWRAADVPVRDGINVDHTPTKARLQKAVDDETSTLVPTSGTVVAEGEILGICRGRIEASNVRMTGLRVHADLSWLAGLNEIVGHPPTHIDARRGALVWRDPKSESIEAVLMGVSGEFDEAES